MKRRVYRALVFAFGSGQTSANCSAAAVLSLAECECERAFAVDPHAFQSPRDLRALSGRLQNATDDPSAVEVCSEIDDNDAVMNELLDREVGQRPFRLTCISSLPQRPSRSLAMLQGSLNASDPKRTFVINLNDEMSIRTKHWTGASKYVVSLQIIFFGSEHLRRGKDYYDFGERVCQRTSAIMTKRWLDIGGGLVSMQRTGIRSSSASRSILVGWIVLTRIDLTVIIHPRHRAGARCEPWIVGCGAAPPPLAAVSVHGSFSCRIKCKRRLHGRRRNLRAPRLGEREGLASYDVCRQRPKTAHRADRAASGRVLQRFLYKLSATRIWLTNALRTANLAITWLACIHSGSDYKLRYVHRFALLALDGFLEEYYAAQGPNPGRSRLYYFRRSLIRQRSYGRRASSIDRRARFANAAPPWSRATQVMNYQVELLRQTTRSEGS